MRGSRVEGVNEGGREGEHTCTMQTRKRQGRARQQQQYKPCTRSRSRSQPSRYPPLLTGLSSAGSSTSTLFVAASSITPLRPSKPSSSVSSWFRVWSRLYVCVCAWRLGAVGVSDNSEALSTCVLVDSFPTDATLCALICLSASASAAQPPTNQPTMPLQQQQQHTHSSLKPVPLLPPIASSSSMNTTQGEDLRASANNSRTRAAPLRQEQDKEENAHSDIEHTLTPLLVPHTMMQSVAAQFAPFPPGWRFPFPPACAPPYTPHHTTKTPQTYQSTCCCCCCCSLFIPPP